MAWDWGVFLKSWLFGFLGFLIGIVSTVIYLAVYVDLSQLDGLSIITVFLVIITGWYAYTTHKILNDQIKSRQISYVRDQLEKLYYPLLNILNGTSEMEIPSIVPFMYLGTEELNEAINKYLVVEYDPDRLTAIEQADICSELELKVNQDIYDFRNKLLDLYGLKNHFDEAWQKAKN